MQFQFNPPEKTEQIIQQILWLNSNILIDKKIYIFFDKKKKSIIFVNVLIIWSGEVVTHAANTDIWKCLSAQNYNQLIAELPQKWKRQVQGENVRNLSVRPALKNVNG